VISSAPLLPFSSIWKWPGSHRFSFVGAALSDAKVAAQEAAAVNLAPGYVPLVSKGLQFTPAAQTHFKSSDHLTAYFEVYEPLLADQPKTAVQAHLRIVNAQTGEVPFQFAPKPRVGHPQK
jgi:hypothetical protein